MRRLVGRAAGAMAARQYADVDAALVPDPLHAHDGRRERGGWRASGAVAGLCPITEANLGDGIFAGAALFRLPAGRFAVGTDSNVRIALNEELRTLEYGQRLREQKRNRLGAEGPSTGRHLFDAARRGGAQALGLNSGSLAAGKTADIVVLDTAHPALAARREDFILDSWIFAGGEGLVSDVFAAGKHVVADGRHVRRDQIARHFSGVVDGLTRDA